MKVSKWITSLALCCSVTAVVGFLTIIPAQSHNSCDIRYRHNEISCSHSGINPYHIWNRTLTSDVYTGISRPDLNAVPEEGKKHVHAYPPWHTTFFWFYGWFSQNTCVVSMFVFNCLAFLIALFYFRRYVTSRSFLFWGCLLMGLSGPFVSVLVTGNYGCLLLLLTICLYETLKRDKQVLAGILWAGIMIKPQVGILYFWPLFWQKKYLTIGVAIAICLVATFWPASVYHESPLELILQVSQLGNSDIPTNTASFSGFAYRLIGCKGPFVWMGFCFLICCLCSYAVRNTPFWFMRVIPVLIIFPYWTYSQGHDYMISWPLYLILGVYISSLDGKIKKNPTFIWMSAIGLIVSTFYMYGWSFVMQMKWVCPAGLGWIYHTCKFLNTGCMVLLMYYIVLFQGASKREQHLL